MKGKPDLIKASQIAAAAKKVGGVYVVATRNQQLPQEENASAQIAGYPLAEYSCKECATVFSANAGMTPHCLTCGSDHTEATHRQGETAGKASRTKVHADADLAHYHCAGCGTINVMHSEIVAACGTGAYCTTCGHHNQFAVATATDLDEAPSEGLDDLELVDTSEDALEAEAEDEGMDDGDTLDLEGDEDGEGEGETTDADALSLETTPLNPPPVPAADIPGQGADTNPVVDVAPGTPDNVEYSEGDDMEVDLLDLNEDAPAEELSLAWFKDSLGIVTSNLQVVATLVAADAGDNADMMETQEFARVVAHTISKQGLKKACASLGFKPVKAKVPIGKVVSAQVEKALAEKAKELSAKLESVHQDFAQATEISAAGFAKNFWKDASDPLKNALITELSTLGVRNPQKLIDRVWAIHAPKTLASILDKAKELSKTSVTARNELAGALDMANYIPTKVKVHAADDEEEDKEGDDEGDEDGDDDTVESRLTTGAKAITHREAVVSNAVPGKPGAGKAMITAILGGQAGHFNQL